LAVVLKERGSDEIALSGLVAGVEKSGNISANAELVLLWPDGLPFARAKQYENYFAWWHENRQRKPVKSDRFSKG